jgi:acyl-CoA thioesterase
MRRHPFVSATTPTVAKDRRRLALAEDWYQGRGVLGGVVAGALARAMAEALPRGDRDRPLRWFSAHFCAPATGVADLEVTPVRRGRSVSHMRAELRRAGDEGETVAFASATFAGPRPSALRWCSPTMPEVPPPASIAPFRDTPTPTFADHLELRFCRGPAPLSGGDVAEMGLWIRFAEPLVVDVPAALALLDAAPPAAMARLRDFRPMATVALACQFFERLPLAGAAADDHYLLVVRSNVCGDGYAEELDELWSADGRLVALCWQDIALL